MVNGEWCEVVRPFTIYHLPFTIHQVMEETFEAIGLELPSEKDFNHLAEGEAIVHGYCDGTETEVLFELQNLTEVGPEGFRAQELHVGLCGLPYRARVSSKKEEMRWRPLEEAAPTRAAHEN